MKKHTVVPQVAESTLQDGLMRNKKMVFYTDMMLSLISFAVMSRIPF